MNTKITINGKTSQSVAPVTNTTISHLTTVKELEAAGYIVDIQQFRYKKNDTTLYRKVEFEDRKNEISANGGYTEVSVTTPSKDKFTAHARCHPVDPFNHKKSLMIAIGRVGKLMREFYFREFVKKNNIQQEEIKVENNL